jgi:methionyl aminopeptidase
MIGSKKTNKSSYENAFGGDRDNGITIKSNEELNRMRDAGRIVGLTLQKLRELIEPGISTMELDRIAEREIRGQGGIPAFKGYRGFPGTLCVSVNEQIVHGIPSELVIKNGDIVSLDLGAIVDGFYGDSAVTVGVGSISIEDQRLLEVCENSLWAGIRQVRPNNRIGDIGAKIEETIENHGRYGIVREYGGHGIGHLLHEEPFIPNFGLPGRGLLLRPGMVIAIEPMVNLGGDSTRVLDDNWTVVTADGARSAHFEHTVAVTNEGFEVLTSA